MGQRRHLTPLLAALLLAPATAWASAADPVASVALSLVVILVGARLAGHLAVRLHQPAVLGELLLGVALGNLHHLGLPSMLGYREDPALDLLGRIGVLLLLFEVGLESTVRQMLQVGLSALAVAVLGVVAPFVLGYGAAMWLIPEQGPYVAAFLGAALTATSVGITARVLQELKKTDTPEARIILGAAVLDDVLGLVILAVVTGVIGAAGGGKAMGTLDVVYIILEALGFLVGSLVLGVWLAPALFQFGLRIRGQGVLLSLGLGLCFLMSWGAAQAGLAPIVGAFAAGLVLEEVHSHSYIDRGELGLEQLVRPITGFLVPVFFVLMGLRTDLKALFQPGVPLLALALTVAAIVGKQVCGLGVTGPGKDKPGGVDRLAVGLGMIPRGEVGLIFASIGAGLTLDGKPVIGPTTYAAVVAMVIVTTLATPPLLKWRMLRRG